MKEFIQDIDTTVNSAHSSAEDQAVCISIGQVRKLLAIVKIQTEALEQIKGCHGEDECGLCGSMRLATSALTKADVVAGI